MEIPRSSALRGRADPEIVKGVRLQEENQSFQAPPPAPESGGLVVVAIGASAGGLEALQEFFGSAVPNPRIGYLVVTHLPAHHVSQIAQLLDRAGPLRVSDLRDGERIEGGKVYVAPPGVLMGFEQGVAAVRLTPSRGAVSLPKPIDHLMIELADDLAERAVGIVLSGADHDGTAGLKAIKAAGGISIVQEPGTARFPSMPNSAIGAGAVDMVLAPGAMPAALQVYLDHLSSLPAQRLENAGQADDIEDGGLVDVLSAVFARTGHDFRWYRPAMLRRRLTRRMALRQLDRVADYLDLIQNSPDEVEALKRDFLIGVTDFFRDPAAWEALAAEVIPVLIANRRADDTPVRTWTPGCATGEESYSVAMLLIESMEAAGLPARVQVFGTDIDTEALAVARHGSYPESIAATVSPDRLARFFDHRGDRYVVRKQLRDAVVFAPHNLISDTPFSRLDLALCRNLLIYFKTELQERVLDVLHFSLNPGGFLLLGKSESAGSRDFLFEPGSKQAKVFRRIGRRAHLPRGFDFASGGPAQWWDPGTGSSDRLPPHSEIVQHHLGEREVHCAILTDREGRALYFHGRSSEFLEPRGEATLEVVALVRTELRSAVRHVVRSAVGQRKSSAQRAALASDSRLRQVQVVAEPVEMVQTRGLILVLLSLDHATEPAGDQAAGDGSGTQGAVEVERDSEVEGRRRLAIALEDAERSNEELRLANEEISTLNEELQSSNEELESSKEELQSVNEELETVNTELEEKLAELARTHDDLVNVLSSTDIATILLDRNLRIRQFTPAAMKHFGLQPGDEGRQLTDIASRVDDPDFLEQLDRVLAAGDRSEAEVRTREGSVLLRRILPFLSSVGEVEGVVATFVDITPLRARAQTMRHLLAALGDSNDAVIAFDPTGAILSWNAGAVRTYGHSPAEAIAAGLFGLMPEAEQPKVRELINTVLRDGRAGPVDAERVDKHGTRVRVSITVTALRDDQAKVYALLSTERDLTERLRHESEMYFRRLADDIPALLRVEDQAGRALFVNSAFAELTGHSRENLLGHGWLEFLHPADRGKYNAVHAEALPERRRFEMDFRMLRGDGVYRWMRSISVPHYGTDAAYGGYVALTLDIDERKQAELALIDADRRKDDFLAMLAHELRNPLAPISNAVELLSSPQLEERDSAWAIGIIGRQTEALSRLLDDLLDVARIARGKINLSVVPVSVSVLMERAVEVSRPLIDLRRHRLTVDMPSPDVVVEGDLVRLAQVLSNLLNNAAKYTDEGGAIRLAATADGAEVTISVSDNGAGLAPEMLPRVFDLFAQADVTLDRSKGGLGLGLTLARQLVELHRGSILARSKGLGLGSEFAVKLPLARVFATTRKVTGLSQDTPQSSKVRVLIVDDNADAAWMLGKTLEVRGHEVTVVHDAEQALAAAQQLRPHAAVLDIGLPGMDGFQLARVLRAHSATSKTLLVAVTGYGRPDDVKQAQDAGFDHHFVKPVNPERLHDLVLQSISGSDLESQ